MTRTIMYPHNAMLDELVAQFFGDAFNGKANGGKYPLTNVYDEDGIAYMEIAVAGFSKEEIEITIDNDTITIKGESNGDVPAHRHYVKRDIAMRNFEKSYSLMFPIDTVEAEFQDGILTIKLVPLIQEQSSKRIEIK
jgi:HSP20 family molecular chaperone IbpA